MAVILREKGEINIKKLINAIKVRPALYNKKEKMNSSRTFKYRNQLWREVCQEVYRNWDRLTTQDKVDYARDVQKRWRNLRTCFARELSLQKYEKVKRANKEPMRRRKKYSYLDDLLFLLPPDKLEEYKNNIHESDSEDGPLALNNQIKSNLSLLRATKVNNANTIEYSKMELEDVDSNQEDIEEEEEVDFSIFNYSKNKNKKQTNDSTLKTKPCDVQPIEYTMHLADKARDKARGIRGTDKDEDKMFALSLVSFFKNLTPKKKLEARIEVLRLLHNISYRN